MLKSLIYYIAFINYDEIVKLNILLARHNLEPVYNGDIKKLGSISIDLTHIPLAHFVTADVSNGLLSLAEEAQFQGRKIIVRSNPNAEGYILVLGPYRNSNIKQQIAIAS